MNITQLGLTATSVWNNILRTLTGFGTSITFELFANHTSLANGAQISVGVAANHTADVEFVGEAVTNAHYQIGLFDGTNNRIGFDEGNSAAAMFRGISTVSMNLVMVNAGTASGFYSYNGFRYNQ